MEPAVKSRSYRDSKIPRERHAWLGSGFLRRKACVEHFTCQLWPQDADRAHVAALTDDLRKFDAVLRERVPLLIEKRHVLTPPVVGEVLDAGLFEHRGTVLGAALLRVEGDDAPGDEVVAVEELLRPRGDVLGLRGVTDAACGGHRGEAAGECDLQQAAERYRGAPSRRGVTEAGHSTTRSPFISFQWPGNVQRNG
jgi:hypothetical protein